MSNSYKNYRYLLEKINNKENVLNSKNETDYQVDLLILEQDRLIKWNNETNKYDLTAKGIDGLT